MKRPIIIITILLIAVVFTGIWVVSGNAGITKEISVGSGQDESTDEEKLIAGQKEVTEDDEEIIVNQGNQVAISEQEEVIKEEVIKEEVIKEDRDELDQEGIIGQEKPAVEADTQDEVEIIDEIGNNVEQPLNEEMVVRFDSKNSVDMGVVYSNLLGDNEEYIVFEIALNNHLINLENFKYDELASLSFGNGTTINDGFIWESTSQGHHVSGLLKLPKDYLDTNTTISDLGSAQLEFEGIGGPENMMFKWEKDVVDRYN